MPKSLQWLDHRFHSSPWHSIHGSAAFVIAMICIWPTVTPSTQLRADTGAKTAQLKKEAAPKSKPAVDSDLQKFLDRVEVSKQGRRRTRHFTNEAGHIVKLDLSGVKTLERDDFSVIGASKHLESLNLYSSNVTDQDMSHLAGLTNLRELILNWCRITDVGFAHTKQMHELETLEIRLTKTTDASVPIISGFKRLKRLKISDTGIGDRGLQMLSTSLPELETLKLGDTKITDGGVKHLAAFRKLKGVTLDETAISNAGLKELAQLPQFRWTATHDETTREFIHRAEQGKFEDIERMSAPGVSLPERGRYKLTKLEKLEQRDRDKKAGQDRYRVEFHWTVPETKTDEFVYILLSVERGTIRGQQVGLIE
ncbi:MAG: hypothetical protein O3A00_17055 [Planctomycetota bacterium]|nr:hypothetical protein [Planctomycetota bacterium]